MKKKLIFITVIVMLLGYGCASGNQSRENPFDYYAECATEQDIKVLSGKSFVERVFSFTFMIFQRPGYDSTVFGQIAIYAAPSLENLEVSTFSRDLLIKEDPAILNSPEKNPIVIDEALAKAERLSVGDKLYQNSNITEQPLEFTVGAIYRHTSVTAQFEAAALINEQMISVFSDIVAEMGYTNVYIKASDQNALKEYLDNEFLPHLALEGLTEEQISVIPREEISAYYEDYESHIHKMGN